MIFKFQWYIVDENGIYNGMITGLKKNQIMMMIMMGDTIWEFNGFNGHGII